MENGEIIRYSGVVENSTHERMDLLAALHALDFLKERGYSKDAPVIIESECQTLSMGLLAWKGSWKKLGWRRKTGPLANLDLWKKIDEYDSYFTLMIPYHRGIHSSLKNLKDRARYEINLRMLKKHRLLADEDI